MSCFTRFLVTGLKAWVPQTLSVRFRYYENKKKFIRRYGYRETIDLKGQLAHTGGDNPVIQMPIYRPMDSWSEKKALFGQNDYIDILGSNDIKLTKIMYTVPMWLRGLQGNEYQMLMRKRKMLRHGEIPRIRPTQWKHLQKRIMYLYKFLNRKTKTGMPKI